MNYHTIALQEYIYFSPEEVRNKFYNGYDWDTEEWIKHTGDCYFLGFSFKNNEVYAMNIYIFQKHKKYYPTYLNITNVFNGLLKEYNIYHTCIILQKILKKYYRESVLVENIIKYIRNDQKYHLPKFRYSITKHHNRERKFCESYEGEHREIWDTILFSSITKSCDFSSLKQQRNERPSSLFISYSSEPELFIREASIQRSKHIPRKRPRKPRRGFNAFNPKTRR